jgi:hypothetical protein
MFTSHVAASAKAFATAAFQQDDFCEVGLFPRLMPDKKK